MRFVSALLTRLFPPMPIDDPADDPITHQLDEAVAAHERQAIVTGRHIDTLRGTIEGVLARLDQAR